jgi:hypothetical protein
MEIALWEWDFNICICKSGLYGKAQVGRYSKELIIIADIAS